MTKSELIDALATRRKIARVTAEEVVNLVFDRMREAETVTARSGARMERSAGAPSASDPPGTRRMRAGFSDSSSTSRDSEITPA